MDPRQSYLSGGKFEHQNAWKRECVRTSMLQTVLQVSGKTAVDDLKKEVNSGESRSIRFLRARFDKHHYKPWE